MSDSNNPSNKPNPVPVSVEILDKAYMVACPAEERPALLESARILDERMRSIRDGGRGRALGTDGMAVITALNAIHELEQHKKIREQKDAELQMRILRLRERVENTLPSAGTEPVD